MNVEHADDEMENAAIAITKVEGGCAEADAYSCLRSMLWPMRDDEILREALEILATPKMWAVFLARNRDLKPLGFAEVRLREYAEGASSSPVGFLEGWYVIPEARNQGVGRRLVEFCEAWARSRGCTEMASNTEIERTESIEAHHHLGYEEVERDVCFLKRLA